MSKQFDKKKRERGPRPSQKQKPKPGTQAGTGKTFSEDALAKLTSKLDETLGSADNKRKNPPTNVSSKQDQKRQRNQKDSTSAKKDQSDAMDLLAEVRALGGDEDDFDMINAIDSDDEEYIKDQKLPVDKKLRDEIAALSKELGLAEYASMDAEVEDENNQDDEDVEEAEVEPEFEESEESEDDNPTKLKIGNMVRFKVISVACDHC